MNGMHDGSSPRVFEYAKMLRANMTKEELKLWDLLKTKPSRRKFRRQHPMSVYVLDFYCHSLRYSIEIDGPNHNVATQKEYDKNRSEYLEGHGIFERIFTNAQVNKEFSLVVRIILNDIDELVNKLDII